MKPSVYQLSLMAFISAVIALLISIYPLSSPYNGFRPEFVCLVVIFWITNAPQHFGVFFAWTIGFLQDILEGVVWGGHAAALAIVAYVCIVAHQRIKNYSVWHQTIWIFVLVGVHQVVVNWIQGLAGYKAEPLYLIFSSVVSALFWPPLFFLLVRLRSLYRLY